MLEKYIESLENQGYYVMFTECLDCSLLRIRISKSGLNIVRYIPLYDSGNYILGIEKIKMNVLMDMVKELNANLKTNNNPRWTDYQVEALTDISNRIIQYGDHQSDNSLRSRLHSIATEVKNVIPMAMIKMKGEEK